jgi:hypothetical protein
MEGGAEAPDPGVGVWQFLGPVPHGHAAQQVAEDAAIFGPEAGVAGRAAAVHPAGAARGAPRPRTSARSRLGALDGGCAAGEGAALSRWAARA